MKNKVLNILTKVKDEKYHVVAIRHLSPDEEYEIGDICRNSYDWNYEYDVSTYDTEDPIELDGTCGLMITGGFEDLEESDIEEAEKLFQKAIKESCAYSGKAVVIAGKRCEYGNDENEVIIECAEVIDIL